MSSVIPIRWRGLNEYIGPFSTVENPNHIKTNLILMCSCEDVGPRELHVDLQRRTKDEPQIQDRRSFLHLPFLIVWRRRRHCFSSTANTCLLAPAWPGESSPHHGAARQFRPPVWAARRHPRRPPVFWYVHVLRRLAKLLDLYRHSTH
jgi:hypothetical protein